MPFLIIDLTYHSCFAHAVDRSDSTTTQTARRGSVSRRVRRRRFTSCWKRSFRRCSIRRLNWPSTKTTEAKTQCNAVQISIVSPRNHTYRLNEMRRFWILPIGSTEVRENRRRDRVKRDSALEHKCWFCCSRHFFCQSSTHKKSEERPHHIDPASHRQITNSAKSTLCFSSRTPLVSLVLLPSFSLAPHINGPHRHFPMPTTTLDRISPNARQSTFPHQSLSAA